MRQKLTLLFIAFALAGCVSTGGVGVIDERLDAELGSVELTAACDEREQKSLAFKFGTWVADVVVSPLAAATANTVAENPLTRSYSRRCADNARAQDVDG